MPEPEACRAPLGPAIAVILAMLVLQAILVLPNQLEQIRPAVLLRLPLELPILVIVLALPVGRAVSLLRIILAALLALLLLIKIADIGAYMAFARPFNLVLDLYFLKAGWQFLNGAFGTAGAVALVGGAVFVVCLMIVILFFSANAISRMGDRHRRSVLGWSGLALALGAVALMAGSPLASVTASRLLGQHAVAVARNLDNIARFRTEAAVDPIRAIPDDRLFAGLRGKDVVLVFVESYGESAIRDPRYAPSVLPVLDAFDATLAGKNYGARSAFLTSTTVGGGSWLAHGTMLSGLRIDSQGRYDALVTSNRATLNRDFHRAGWSTVAIEPAITMAWPEARFFGYDRIYAAKDLGYRGKPFNWITMPDQYTMSALQRLELAKRDRPPVMVEMALISSHAPWTPLPEMVPWQDVGDGQIFNRWAESGDPPDVVWRDPDRVRLQYRLSIEYALANLASFVDSFGNDDLVLILLGDHQPAPLITGKDASRNVPIHIIATEPTLSALSGWGWTPGMAPSGTAPVWPMEDFRARFVAAFSMEPCCHETGGGTPSRLSQGGSQGRGKTPKGRSNATGNKDR